ncbi:hypothetical protein LZ30DRAFT_778784 [Colletotrichum cereale]|nr:hypothetical protein LZ30DRAFT_778784 [Colletotrichum cereale]
MKISSVAVATLAVLVGNAEAWWIFKPIPIRPLTISLPLRIPIGGGGGGGGGAPPACNCPAPICPPPTCPAPDCPENAEYKQRKSDIKSCTSAGKTAIFRGDGSLRRCI